MNTKLSFWQIMALLFVLLKLNGTLFIGWWQALAPLAVHLLIRLEYQLRLIRSGKKVPLTHFLE